VGKPWGWGAVGVGVFGFYEWVGGGALVVHLSGWCRVCPGAAAGLLVSG